MPKIIMEAVRFRIVGLLKIKYINSPLKIINMGTRHLQTVINKEGDIIVQQYGQWDGYPDGQGLEILSYLRGADLDKYQENLDKIPVISEKQMSEIDANDNWVKEFPYLHRDCGSKLHKMIEEGWVKFVYHKPLEECKQWCEGFYTIDFQKGLFITEYYDHKVSFKLSELPSDDEYVGLFAEEE